MIALSLPSPAAGLLDIYQLALANDPAYKQSIARKNAVLEDRPQALSQLLPNLSLRANISYNRQDISAGGGFGSDGEVDFDARGYNLSLTQPLFNWDHILQLGLADSRILEAETEALRAEQDLIIRVTESYFDVLHDLDNIDFAAAEKKSLDRQLQQAKQRLEVGLAAITDSQEAQAGYDRAVADEILALNDLDNSHEAMRAIIDVPPPSLAALGDDLPLVAPEPADIDAWRARALEQNMQVLAATHALAVAEQQIHLQTAGHYPTLDLTANHGFNQDGGRFGDSEVETTRIGIELNMPIYAGGATRSRVRQAHHNYNLALEQLEQARRAAQRSAREAYLGVLSGVSRIRALKQAVVSGQTALTATEIGFEVGTRTTVDLVAAERTLLLARRDHSRARYDYILNGLRLKRAAGTLYVEDLHQLSRWLIE